MIFFFSASLKSTTCLGGLFPALLIMYPFGQSGHFPGTLFGGGLLDFSWPWHLGWWRCPLYPPPSSFPPDGRETYCSRLSPAVLATVPLNPPPLLLPWEWLGIGSLRFLGRGAVITFFVAGSLSDLDFSSSWPVSSGACDLVVLLFLWSICCTVG